MKIQTRKLLISLGTLGTIGAASIGSLVAYGRISKRAKGWDLKNIKSSEFMLGDEYTNEYDYKFIDNLGSVDKEIGTYIPPKTGGNSNSYGIVKSKGKITSVDDFIDNFRKENNSQYPLFTIKSSYFTFDNRYLAAVSADDWAKLAFWFLGDSNTNGNLSYGPEAGSVSTFQIIPGIKRKGSSISLGSYSMIKKEKGVITFYPDGFFGASKLFSTLSRDIHNRLGYYIFGNYIEFTIDEVKEIIDVFNQGMELAENDSDPKIQKEFGKKGKEVPRPLSIIPSSLSTDKDGNTVQKYKILSEFFTARPKDYNGNNYKSGKSLLEKIGDEFPELLSKSIGYYVEKNSNGLYEVKNGEHKSWDPNAIIGLPQILKAIDPNFKGFGIDFLKYVAIHEFGHHQTLINASDLSEGGYITSPLSTIKKADISGLNNLDVLNDYLKARSSGIQAVVVDAYGKELTSDEIKTLESPYLSFRLPNGKIEDYSDIVGEYLFLPQQKVWTPNPFSQIKFRAFKKTIEDLDNDYVTPYNNDPNNINQDMHIYDAYIMNSFDNISGTLNPSTDIYSSARSMPPVYTILDDAFTDDFNTDPQGNISGEDIYNILTLEKPWGPDGKILKDVDNKDKEIFYKSFITQTNNQFTTNRPDRLGQRPNGENPTIIEERLFHIFNWFKRAYDVETIDPNFNPNAQKPQLYKRIRDLSNKYFIYIASHFDSIGRTNTQAIESFVQNFVSVTPTPPLNAKAGKEKFYDLTTKGWISFEKMISQVFFDSDKNGPKQVLINNSGSSQPDVDLTTFGFAPTTNQNEPYKFNLIEPDKILNSDGINWLENWKVNIKDPQDNITSDDAQQAKKAYIDIVINPMIKHIFNLNFGHTGNYIAQPKNVRQPVNTDFHFPDYVYNYSEAMTRDLVQISLPQEDTYLSNTNPFLSISQSGTSLEYFVDKSITKNYDPSNIQNRVSMINAERFSNFIQDKINAGEIKDSGLVQNLLKTSYIVLDQYIDENDFLFKDKYSSNGYEKDRQQRELLGWSLYKTDGTARPVLTTDGIKIKNPRDNSTSPTSWAEAYWYFLLRMRGIGDRNITSVFRDPNLDLVYTYGFMDLRDASISNGQQKPEFLAFKNTQTGKVVYQKIYYQNQNTLFYLKHQGDDSTRHSLKDEDYIAWSTNRFAAGQYVNEDLTLGDYEVYFANIDKSRSNLKFTMGSRNYIAENGKFYKQAPTLFIKQPDDSVIYRVKKRFNGG